MIYNMTRISIQRRNIKISENRQATWDPLLSPPPSTPLHTHIDTLPPHQLINGAKGTSQTFIIVGDNMFLSKFDMHHRVTD